MPSFFLVDTEVRSFSPAGVGAVVASELGAIIVPVGLLGDGTRVFLTQMFEGDEPLDCDSTRLLTMAP